MTGIGEFIAARLDEDEQAARKTFVYDQPGAEHWQAHGWNVWTMEARPSMVAANIEPIVSEHMVRQGPAKTLAAVARDRKVLARHTPVEPTPGLVVLGGFHGPRCAECGYRGNGGGFTPWPCVEVRDLAAVWSGHENFRMEWMNA